MRLNELRDNEGATRNRKRVGRGIGSGKGKTAGRGHKGQKSRSGVAIKGFEGGQMPIYRRVPKRGFNNFNVKDYNEINIDRIEAAVSAGKLNSSETVTIDALLKAGVIKKVKDGVRLLGNGEAKTALAYEVTGVSKSALASVENAGGSVKIVTLAKNEPLNTVKGDKRKAKLKK